MSIIVKKRSDYEWDVVEEKGVRERVLETHPLEDIAIKRMREINARRAQEAMGGFGTFTAGQDGAAPKGCTCASGIALEAVPCPVHGG
jgi:hypothetical protein